MPSLYVLSGPNRGSSFALTDGDTSIGRASENPVMLTDESVSMLHARVRREGHGYVVEDLDSSNGTFLNTGRIDRHSLVQGDRIRVGTTELVYLEDKSALPSSSDGKRVVVEDEDTDRRLKLTWTDREPMSTPIRYEKTTSTARSTLRKHAALLIEVARKLSNVLQVEDLLQELLALLSERFKAQRGFVMLLEQKANRLQRRFLVLHDQKEKKGAPVSRTLIEQVVTERKPVLSYDATKDARFSASQSVIDLQMRAVMCAPILRGDRILGVVHLDSEAESGLFGREDLELLSVICDEAAISVENAQLYTELKRIAVYNASILSGLSEGLVVVDREERVTTVNLPAERMLGFTAQRLAGRPLSDHRWLSPLAELITEVYSEDQPRFHQELQLDPPGRESIWVDCSINLIDDGQQTTGAVILLIDLTDRKRLVTTAERSERLAAIGRAVAGVAHEMRSPLSTIRVLMLLLDKAIDSPQQKTYVEQVLSAIDRASRLCEELLDFARRKELMISEVRLEDLIEIVLAEFAVEMDRRGVTLDKQFHETGWVSLDPDKFRQILCNLTSNALQAMGERGGTLTFATGIKPVTRPGLDQVWVEVRDTGEGIPTELIGRIFDAFFTNRKEGTGLGLYICHELVRQHGGEIEVVSRPHIEGTAFRVWFPRSQN